MQPSYIIRQAGPEDHRQILRLARELNSVNLPTDSTELATALDRSVKSFAAKIRRRADATYIFCVEDLTNHGIVAASMIIAKHGTPESPHYYFEMATDERYSQSLHRMFRHPFLRLRYSMDGPSELGGLIVDTALRHHPEKIGKQISWVRLLYIAKHRKRFEQNLIAEILAPATPDGGNRFWDYYGGPVTGLSYREADRLSTRDKEFIRTLFPDSPLYTFLLPKDVLQSVGQIAESSRGAVRLLEQGGMKFLGQIDPFDAGPYYGAKVEDLIPVKEFRTLSVVAGEPDVANKPLYLVAREGPEGFRAVQARVIVKARHLAVTPEVLKALGISEGDRIEAIPLP